MFFHHITPYNMFWSGGVALANGVLLFWAAMIVGFYLLVRAIAQRGRSAQPSVAEAVTPRAMLDRRLAAGEINLEEYDTLRLRLES